MDWLKLLFKRYRRENQSLDRRLMGNILMSANPRDYFKWHNYKA